MKELQIRGEGGNIYVQVFAYERSAADNDSDANWLNCDVNIEIPPFSGRYDASFSTHDFLEFGRELDALYENLSGQAVFETDEGGLNLRLVMQSRGEMVIEGEAVVGALASTTLKFKLRADQSFLGELRRAVAAILKEFPARTYPPAEGRCL